MKENIKDIKTDLKENYIKYSTFWKWVSGVGVLAVLPIVDLVIRKIK